MAADDPYWCLCSTRCGDDSTEVGTCKGLPLPPKQPLVEVVLVPRKDSRENP